MSEFDPSHAHDFPYSNCTVWEIPGVGLRRVLVYLGQDGEESHWAFLGFGRSIVGYPCCVMNAQHWEDGAHILKRSELPEKLKKWRCIGFWAGQDYPEVHRYEQQPADPA